MQTPSAALSALSPAIGLAVNCGVHVAISRMYGPTAPYRNIVRAAVVGLLIVTAICCSLPALTTQSSADATASMLLNVATYAGLAFGYFSFVNLSLTSLRIRMLRELRDAGGCLPLATLHANYGNEVMVGVRLQRLIAGGHITQRDDTMYPARSLFLTIARLFDFLRWFVLGPQGTVGRRPVLH